MLLNPDNVHADDYTFVPISEIKISKKFRQDLRDLKDIKESISELGLLHAIVVSKENELICGARRLESCKQLGWKEIPAHVVNLEDIRRGVIDENTLRKSFTPSEIADIADYFESTIENRVGRPRKNGGKLPPFTKGKKRDIIARRLGVSGRTLDKIREINREAKTDPLDQTSGEHPVFTQARLRPNTTKGAFECASCGEKYILAVSESKEGKRRFVLIPNSDDSGQKEISIDL